MRMSNGLFDGTRQPTGYVKTIQRHHAAHEDHPEGFGVINRI